MWSNDDGPFAGRHYELAETICSPRPVSNPHPQVLIGGGGEHRTLALVARYADACNLFGDVGIGCSPQARGAESSLRGAGPSIRDDREDHRLPGIDVD